ncbi:MAG: NAD-dependent epimerase/dehydratase family protein, partial [Planctomycetota bacterium]
MRPPDPVVFVFGATGYVGAAACEAAAREEHVARVVAHVRPGSSRAEALENRLRARAPAVEIDRTPLEASALARTLRELEPTHVFLCHGTTARRARAEGIEDPYATVDLGLTELVVGAAGEVDPPPRLVDLSAVGTSA